MRLIRVSSLSYLLAASANLLPLAAQTPASTTAPVTDDETVKLEKFVVTEMKSFSDQAISGKTPVAFSEMPKETLAAELGSRDIPLALNTTPSVFATADGGGAGDARVNVRGFSQRNVSILINGVPTNDIENGWLYWSNWDGLGDVTSTIQMQRGLSNVTLPTPSIGGTMNIITDPATSKRGGSLKLELGSDEFYKATVVYNTGMLKGKFALTTGLVAKRGDGYVAGTWTRGNGFYLGSTWKVNTTNRLELFAITAPQQHGQRTFASNIAAYDTAYATKLGYTDAQIAAALSVGPVGSGQNFNPNYAIVNPEYTGRQFYWGNTHARMDDGYIGERVNYFNKPQLNLNWYSTLSQDLKLTTVAYYSGGDGGGSGTLNNGSSSAAFARYSNSHPLYGSNIDWNRTIASNQGTVAANGTTAKTAGRSLGILRNSVNQQDQFGLVSKLTYTLTPELKLTTGIDWRTAKIDHFREVRDLLGGDYYLATTIQSSQFWADGLNTQLRLGDKVDYDSTNTIDWLGSFAQAQYDNGALSAFAVYAFSTIDYAYTDHFRRASAGSNEEYTLDPDSSQGQQIKGGVNYAFTEQFSAYVNAGWVSKAPIFDGVINDTFGTLVTDQKNEKFVSYETGLRWENAKRDFNISAGAYSTKWTDRTLSITSESANTITYLRNIASTYSGLEIESAYRPCKFIRFDFAASFGKWKYDNDVTGELANTSTGVSSLKTYYLQGLQVGDAPQSQAAYGVTFYPQKGLTVKIQGRWYDRYWSDFNSESRTSASDRGQSWRVPSYSVYDLHVSYDLPIESRSFDINLFAHVFNVLDKTYISDATDNSSFEAITSAPSHSAQRAEVFFGTPLSFNMGVKVKF